MPNLPNRCQHLKVNGTLLRIARPASQPFLLLSQTPPRRNHPAQQGSLRRPRNTAFTLPVLEDANSIQVSLMQIMRLIIAGQIEGKTAGLLLYALQTASSNLPRTNFQPYLHDVVLDVKTVNRTPLNSQIWREDDFAGDEEEDEEDFIPRTAAGRAALPPRPNQPHAKRPLAKPTLDEVRKKVTAQIKQALPAIAAAVAANGGH